MRLMTLAMPVMANLYQQFASPSLEVQLANRDGEILRIVGAAAQRRAMADGTLPVLSIAVPIHGTDGCLLIAADHAATSRENSDHIRALLQTTVEMIEHRLVESDERGFLRLHFHARQALLGGPLEALAVFDQDSRFVAINRTAATLLAVGGDLARLRCNDCFDVQWLNLVGYASLRLIEPFPLRTCDGERFFARTTLRQGIV
ncbi:Fis family transcriptional regulator [Thauera sinica]|nr:Fis family transcriptional regulator [Thauera sp. K11]